MEHLADPHMHFSLIWFNNDDIACGADATQVHATGTPVLPAVTCPACLESPLYKEAAVTIEIGFDGDWRAWHCYMHEKYK